jgi:hypothetical protein
MTKHYTAADLAARLKKDGMDVDFKYRANPKRSAGPSESDIQQEVIRQWAALCASYGLAENLLMAFPLQAARTPRNGARMKREGMRKGTLDLFLAVPAQGYHGLWIEMKTEKGVVSDEQTAMLVILNEQNYVTAVCRDVIPAMTEIKMYLNLRRL